MTIRAVELVRAVVGAWSVAGIVAGAKALVRYVSVHTGLPALLVAALLVCVGYRVLKRTARFAVEVVAVAVLLMAATQFGWIRW